MTGPGPAQAQLYPQRNQPSATIFVFSDGHRISAKSYAIAGQTLWIFSEQSARKYQLADLDAAATEQANAANGVEFHVPTTKH